MNILVTTKKETLKMMFKRLIKRAKTIEHYAKYNFYKVYILKDLGK